MLNKIVSVAVLPNFHLRLDYDDGASVLADFNPTIRQGGVFAPLADTTFFSKAALEDHGRVVCWPGELEFCADALRQSSVSEPRQTVTSSARLPYEHMTLVEDI